MKSIDKHPSHRCNKGLRLAGDIPIHAASLIWIRHEAASILRQFDPDQIARRVLQCRKLQLQLRGFPPELVFCAVQSYNCVRPLCRG